jgi:hypothetical protein
VIRILLDENMPVRLVDALGRLGIDAISVNTDHKGLDDPSLLLTANTLDRVFVTHNTADFRLLHTAWQTWSKAWDVRECPIHSGMLLIHSATGYDPERMALTIESLPRSGAMQESLRNHLWIWTVKTGWFEG